MTEVTSDTPTDPFIYPHQRAAFDRLCAVARAYIHSNFERLPIQPRGNLFLVGPSGTGKTHLARVGIPEATRLAQGPRFFEEILLEAVVQERLEISSPLQPQPPILLPAHGNGTDIGA